MENNGWWVHKMRIVPLERREKIEIDNFYSNIIFLSICNEYFPSSKYFSMPIIFISKNFKAMRTRRKSRKMNYRYYLQ